MNQELENYIKEERAVGTNDEAIKQKLRDNGWADEMFKDSFVNNITQQKPYLHEVKQEAAKHNKLIFIIIASIVVLTAGAYFAFAQGVFNFSDDAKEEIQEEVNQEQVVVVDEEENIDKNLVVTDDQDIEEGVVAVIFGEKIFLEDIQSITNLYLAINKNYEPDESTFNMYGGFKGDHHYNYSINDDVFITIMEASIIKETLKRSGLTPMTEEELLSKGQSQAEIKETLEELGLGFEYIDDYKHLLKYTLRRHEIYELMAEGRLQAAYPIKLFKKELYDLAENHVKETYDAFNHRLNYLNEDEKYNLRPELFSNYDFFLETKDPAYPSFDKREELIKNVDISPKLKNELLALENSPNILTSLIDDGQYYYFGMVFSPEKNNPSSNFTVEDALIARFPIKEIYFVGDFLTLLFKEGVAKGEIVIYETDELQLVPLINYLDEDGDGLSNMTERLYGTKLNEVDTDKDGKTDKEEYDMGTNPLKSN